MPHSSTRTSTRLSSRLATGSMPNENQQLIAPSRTGNGRKAAANGARLQVHQASMSMVPHSNDQSSDMQSGRPVSPVIGAQTNTGNSNCAAQNNAPATTDDRLSDSTNVNRRLHRDPGQADAMEELRLERDRLQAEVERLRNQANSLQPTPTLIARPEGRRIKLQQDMGLANDRIRFLSIRRTIKDAVKRAGLDYMVRWERQPKDKLAKIFWVAKDRQPYLKRFAHDWPIEEYIKRHHKNVRAYMRRLSADGTDATLPNVESDEISDSQGEMASNPDMYLDDA